MPGVGISGGLDLTHADTVPAELEVVEACAVADTLDFAQLVLDQVEVVEVRVGEGRVGRVVLELAD